MHDLHGEQMQAYFDHHGIDLTVFPSYQRDRQDPAHRRAHRRRVRRLRPGPQGAGARRRRRPDHRRGRLRVRVLPARHQLHPHPDHADRAHRRQRRDQGRGQPRQARRTGSAPTTPHRRCCSTSRSSRPCPSTRCATAWPSSSRSPSVANGGIFELLEKYGEDLLRHPLRPPRRLRPELREVAHTVTYDAIETMLTLEVPNLQELDLDRVIAFGHTWSPTLELTPRRAVLPRPRDQRRHGVLDHDRPAPRLHLGQRRDRILGLMSRLGLSLDSPHLTPELLRDGHRLDPADPRRPAARRGPAPDRQLPLRQRPGRRRARRTARVAPRAVPHLPARRAPVWTCSPPSTPAEAPMTTGSPVARAPAGDPGGILAARLDRIAGRIDGVGRRRRGARGRPAAGRRAGRRAGPVPRAAAPRPSRRRCAALAERTRSEDWAGRGSGVAVLLEQEMLSGHVEGQPAEDAGARRPAPGGCWRSACSPGYSALAMAEALPADGRLVACELDADVAGFAQRVLRGVAGGGRDLRSGSGRRSARSTSWPRRARCSTSSSSTPTRPATRLPRTVLDAELLAPDGLVCVDNTLMQGEPWLSGELDGQRRRDRRVQRGGRRRPARRAGAAAPPRRPDPDPPGRDDDRDARRCRPGPGRVEDPRHAGAADAGAAGERGRDRRRAGALALSGARAAPSPRTAGRS